MWTIFLSGLLRPKVLLGLGLAGLVLGVFLWYGAHESALGYASGSRAQLDTDKTQFAQVLKQYQDSLQQDQQQINASDLKIQALNGQLQTISAQLVALASQRQQQQQQVASLPDSQLQADLETTLGGPLSSPVTLRKADQIVRDYPLVLKQVDSLTSQTNDLSQKVDALDSKVEGITKQRDVAIQFGNTMVGYYTKAFNAAQTHHNRFIKIITLGIVHDKHLNLPEPTTLDSTKVL